MPHVGASMQWAWGARDHIPVPRGESSAGGGGWQTGVSRLLAEGQMWGSGGVLRLFGGGRIARERMGMATPKRWDHDKVRASGGGGVVKKRKSEEGYGKKDFKKDGRGSTGRLSKEEQERLRLKKKSYKDLIKRSKEWRTDRKCVCVSQRERKRAIERESEYVYESIYTEEHTCTCG